VPINQGSRLVYATSASFTQQGIDSCPKAFGKCYQRGYQDVARKGLTQRDNPAIQNVAAASNENWTKESADWQKSHRHRLIDRVAQKFTARNVASFERVDIQDLR
jgi:uncharacterized NAD(P)/FAD-binding protein YdhS